MAAKAKKNEQSSGVSQCHIPARSGKRSQEHFQRQKHGSHAKVYFGGEVEGETVLGWVVQWMGSKEMQMESLDNSVEKF